MSFRVKQPQKFYFPNLQIKITASFPLTATQMGHLSTTINCGENSGLWSLPVASIWTWEEYTWQTPQKELLNLYWIAVELQVITQVLCYKVIFDCPELTLHSNYGLTTPRKKTQPLSSCFEEKHLGGRCVLKDRLCSYGSKIIILLSDLLQISHIILDGVHCLWTLLSKRWCWDAYARGDQWEIVLCASTRYRITPVSCVRDI